MENPAYKKHMKEIMDNAGVPYSEIFDYEDSKIAEIYDRFFNFCQTNLSGHSQEYDIQPAAFYFGNDFDVNAVAFSTGTHNLIEMNMGTIFSMYNHFYDYNDVFENDPELHKKYPSLTQADIPPGFFMYQVATQFTYYHERGHLIQHSPYLSSGLNEKSAGTVGKTFDPTRHLLEFDADYHAAHWVCYHILEYWKKLQGKPIDPTKLNLLLSLAISAIFTYFVYLEGPGTPLYYAENSHPHPMVRLTYIMDIFIHVAEMETKASVKMDHRKILREGFDIAERFCRINKLPNSVDRYAGLFISEGPYITEYINLLIKESDKIPYLGKNRQ